MAITVKHSKTSLIADAGDATLVQPSDWNADHTLTGTVPVANGGTGASTANDGFNALAPSQTGNTGKYLTTNGTDSSWSVNPLGTVTSVATGTGLTGGPITTSGTISIDSTVATLTGTQTLTNKTISGASNTLSNIGNTSLTNSTITINGTSTALGGSVSVGTVTSVAATAGTGITVSGSPITTSGTLTITNSAPDQTVVLTAGTGISTSGTYPNFTITNTSPSSGGTVTSVTGTAPVVSSGGNTPAISMPAATTSVNGYLTSTDWNTFNGKSNTNGTVTSVAALTLGTTGTDLSSTVATGTTTPVITLQVPTASATNRGALSAADWTTFNNKGSGTVTSVSGTAPVVSSGGATPAISMAAATGSVSGYLTSTDWTTFNNKGSGSVTAVSVVSANGFTGTSSGGATPALTLTTSITGMLKGNGSAISAGTAGTDYVAPATATSFTAQQYFGNVALTDAATIAWAANTAQVATFTFVSSNRTMGAPTGLVSGAYYGLAVIQNSGSNTLTWNSVFKWAGGTAPTLSTAASAKDYFVFRTDGTNLYEQGRSLGVA